MPTQTVNKYKFGPKPGKTVRQGLLEYALDELDVSDEEIRRLSEGEYYRYQWDPCSFGEVVLGERYTHDIKMVMESVRDNPITIAMSANGTGKTHAAARIGFWFYKCFDSPQVYMAAAPPESNLKRLLWGQVGHLTEEFPELLEDEDVSLPSMKINRNSLIFIEGVTIPAQGTEKEREARFSGKHAPSILFIIDEGDAVPAEVYRGIESCMSGGLARLLIMFNPRVKSGPVYDMMQSGVANVIQLSAFRHPNVYVGRDIFPGAVTREQTVRRINLWTVPDPDADPKDPAVFRTPSFLVGETAQKDKDSFFPPLEPGRRRVIDPSFSYMVLARYPDAMEDQLFNESWIDAARNRWDILSSQNGGRPPAFVRPIQGLDVADLGDDLSVSFMRYGGWVDMPSAWGGVDPLITGERAFKLYAKHHARFCNVDSTGVGAGVSHHMKRMGAVAYRVMVGGGPEMEEEKRRKKNKVYEQENFFKERAGLISQGLEELVHFKIMRDRMFWAFREWLRTDPTATLPPVEKLIAEMRACTYEKHPITGKIMVANSDKLKERVKRSADHLNALALTFVPPQEETLSELHTYNYRNEGGRRSRRRKS